MQWPWHLREQEGLKEKQSGQGPGVEWTFRKKAQQDGRGSGPGSGVLVVYLYFWSSRGPLDEVRAESEGGTVGGGGRRQEEW